MADVICLFFLAVVASLAPGPNRHYNYNWHNQRVGGEGLNLDLTLKSCASGLYALKVLRAHAMPASSLHDVFNAAVLEKMLYCSPAWSGYCSAADCNRLDAFLRKAYKLGFYANISNTIMNRVYAADDAFFGRIINNSSHVMRPLLHECLSNQYNLRSRHHDFTLINKTNLLTDNSFIIRMLYTNCY